MKRAARQRPSSLFKEQVLMSSRALPPFKVPQPVKAVPPSPQTIEKLRFGGLDMECEGSIYQGQFLCHQFCSTFFSGIKILAALHPPNPNLFYNPRRTIAGIRNLAPNLQNTAPLKSRNCPQTSGTRAFFTGRFFTGRFRRLADPLICSVADSSIADRFFAVL